MDRMKTGLDSAGIEKTDARLDDSGDSKHTPMMQHYPRMNCLALFLNGFCL